MFKDINARFTSIPIKALTDPRAAVVHLNFRAGSTFPVPVFTVPIALWKGLAGATRLTWSDFMRHIG